MFKWIYKKHNQRIKMLELEIGRLRADLKTVGLDAFAANHCLEQKNEQLRAIKHLIQLCVPRKDLIECFDGHWQDVIRRVEK